VDEIRLHPIDGKLQIELKGDLATLVGFADQYDPDTKKPGSTGDPSSTKWLVAGARSRRCLHLDYAALIIRRQKNHRFLRASSASVVRHCSLIDFRMTCPSVSFFDIRTKCISEIGNRN
jgi:hypothetical protein